MSRHATVYTHWTVDVISEDCPCLKLPQTVEKTDPSNYADLSICPI